MCIRDSASVARALAWHGWGHLDAPISEKVLVVFIETLETIVGYVSNTLSFLRVAAFSLNHAALALAVFTPVSYTHLDVYKRQVHPTPGQDEWRSYP